jgi:hypothetical protein
MTGLRNAFGCFGAKGKTPFSWFARTPDGRVVTTFWQDQFVPRSRPLSYSNIGSSSPDEWHQPGVQEHVENLKWARDHWGGKMGVVIVVAVDRDAQPRRIAKAFCRKDLLMQLNGPIRETGEFSAVNVGKWDELKASDA